jgi:hypothetical protein
MNIIRPSECKNIKKLAIMIVQDKKDGSTSTTIDYVGNDELKKEYDKSLMRDLLAEFIKN